MHVLVVPSWYPRSREDISGSFFREQALALHCAGIQTGVLAVFLRSIRKGSPLEYFFGQSTMELDHGMPTMRRIGVNVYLGNIRRRSGWHVRSAIPLFDAYVERHGKPDVLHAHSLLFAAAVAGEIKRKYGIPFVITEHSSAYLRDRLSRLQWTISKSLAGEASVRLAVSSEFARKLEQKLAPASDVEAGATWRVLPNLVEASFFGTDLFCDRMGAFHFVTLGSLDENKRVDLVLRAFAKSFPNTQQVRLTIVGEGPQRGMLEYMSSDLGIRERTEFVGRVPRSKVPAILASSHCMVMASRFETFGVAAAEALACGVPVIGTRCGGLEDVLQEGDGQLIDVDDELGLAIAMERMVQRYSELDRAGIRERCRRRFSADAIVARLREIYAEVIHGSAFGKCDASRRD